jgi:hypothetical protein
VCHFNALGKIEYLWVGEIMHVVARFTLTDTIPHVFDTAPVPLLDTFDLE